MTTENRTKIIVETETEAARQDFLDIEAAQKNVAKSVEQASASGAMGFRVLGKAAENAAEALGLPFRAANQLGNTVERSAKSALPSYGMALGAVGLAAAGLVLGIKALIDRQAEEEAQTKKLADGAHDYILKMMDQRDKTEALARAEYVLFRQRWAEERENMRKRLVLIDEETIKLEERRAVIEKNTEFQDQLDSYTAKTLGDMTMRIGGYEREKASIEELAKAREMSFEAFRDQLFGKDGAAKLKEEGPIELEIQAALYKDNLKMLENYQADKQYAEQKDFEQAQMIRKAVVDMDNEALEQRRLDALAEIELERQKNAALKQLQMTYTQTHMNLTSQALDAYVAVTGKRNAAIFLAQKALAIGQIWVDTERAAVSAMATAAVLGPVAATAAYGEMKTLGYISMGIAGAAALGQMATGTWSGGGSAGGGGGATGTYAASPGTGQPVPYQMYYEQDPKNPANYGSGWRPGEGQSNNGVSIIVQGDVYAQDADAFQAKVVNAAAKDYKDQGALYSSING